MNQVTRIQQTLQPHLGWHGARVSFLALFLIAVFRVKTVNLSELATAFISTAQPESHYKRLQRFLGGFELDYYTIARFVVSLMDIPQPWVLSVDRTTWEFGGCVHNILMRACSSQRRCLSLAVVDALLRDNYLSRIESSDLTGYQIGCRG